MPLFFLHGVNVRKEDKDYEKEVARRGKLFRDLLLAPLSERGERFKKIELHDIYWGDLGVTFGWKLASLPKVKTLQSFGPGEEPLASDVAIADSLESMSSLPAHQTTPRTSAPADSTLKQAATHDPVRFAETLLLPLLLSDFELSEENTSAEGELQALLARATVEAAADPRVQDRMAAAASDDELIKVLSAAIEQRFRTLAQSAVAADGEPGTESYGSKIMDYVRPRVRELFSRVLNLPGRAASLPVLQFLRPRVHRRFSRFLGDVFVYLQKRGDASKPGPIVQRVMAELNAVPKQHPDEPVIVVTHSMGGNILYDILTTFAPKLFVDVWISVGGQVAQFEEMKLFLASDPKLGSPTKVDGIKKRVGYWLNVYDPSDSFSFMVDPVFAGVDADVPFSTGASALKSHGEYFGLASFHGLMREHIEKGLRLA